MLTALRAAQAAETIVYSIIIVPIEASAGRDTGGEHALIQISTDTGGKTITPRPFPNSTTLFRKISDELRTQYLLAYYPVKRFSDSDFRRVEIKLTGPAASGLPRTLKSLGCRLNRLLTRKIIDPRLLLVTNDKETGLLSVGLSDTAQGESLEECAAESVGFFANVRMTMLRDEVSPEKLS